MTEAQFNQQVDELMFSIEEAIDDSGADLDYENGGGMLTITCEMQWFANHPISASAPQRDMAGRALGRFHFNLQSTEEGEVWLNTVTREPLADMLSEACLAQSGEQINFEF